MKTTQELLDYLNKNLSAKGYFVTMYEQSVIEPEIIVVSKDLSPWCLITKNRYRSLQMNIHLFSNVEGYLNYQYWVFWDDDDNYDVIDRRILSSSNELPLNPERRLNIAKESLTGSKQLLSFLQQDPLSLKEKIILEFKNAINNYKYRQNKVKQIVDSLTQDDIECEDGVVKISESIENQLFNCLIGNYDEREVCRYTSLNSLFQSLSSQTFRMYGLAGMNDKGERDFFQDAIYQGSIRPTYLRMTDAQQTESSAERYIMSCTSIKKIDLLEMWRLYADDAKGVCLVFEKLTLDSDFSLIPIRYDRCSDVKSDWTPQFKFIMDITRQLGDRGLLLQFHKFEDWKICVKSGEYNYEKEVRLVYIPKDNTKHKAKQWVLTNTNSIVNPYVELALTDVKAADDELPMFPLKLKKIILGPKCPEAEVNKEQIERLLSLDPDLNKLGIKVEISKIHNYR